VTHPDDHGAPAGAAPTGTTPEPTSGSDVRIADLIAAGPTLSVEFFPPKSDEGEAQLVRTVEELRPLDLSFVSVTYGAGGSTRDRTRDLVVRLNAEQSYPAMAHLTCVGSTRAELDALLDDYDAHGVHDILALAGDPPADGSPAGGDFTYALELVELVRARGPQFSVGVAAHPELHPRSPDRSSDRDHLAAKLRAADFGVTQFFFDPDDYTAMIDDLAARDCTTPVLPGVMPLSNPTGIARMAEMSGATFPADLAARVESAEGGERDRIVVDAAAELCRELLDRGAPGVHLYCLNRSPVVLAVSEALGLR
jgi:methylenetetrahydrofolate reductase (NADPH)